MFFRCVFAVVDGQYSSMIFVNEIFVRCEALRFANCVKFEIEFTEHEFRSTDTGETELFSLMVMLYWKKYQVGQSLCHTKLSI